MILIFPDCNYLHDANKRIKRLPNRNKKRTHNKERAISFKVINNDIIIILHKLAKATKQKNTLPANSKVCNGILHVSCTETRLYA